MTLPHWREPSSTPALRPYTSLHRTHASTESNTSLKSTLLKNSFPNQKQKQCTQTHCTESNTSSKPNSIVETYEAYFVYALSFYLCEIDSITASLPSSFTIAPKFGPLSLSISRQGSRKTITYDFNSNRPLTSFLMDLEFLHSFTQDHTVTQTIHKDADNTSIASQSPPNFEDTSHDESISTEKETQGEKEVTDTSRRLSPKDTNADTEKIELQLESAEENNHTEKDKSHNMMQSTPTVVLSDAHNIKDSNMLQCNVLPKKERGCDASNDALGETCAPHILEQPRPIVVTPNKDDTEPTYYCTSYPENLDPVDSPTLTSPFQHSSPYENYGKYGNNSDCKKVSPDGEHFTPDSDKKSSSSPMFVGGSTKNDSELNDLVPRISAEATSPVRLLKMTESEPENKYTVETSDKVGGTHMKAAANINTNETLSGKPDDTQAKDSKTKTPGTVDDSQKRADSLQAFVLKAVTNFREYFLHSFELKLDQSRVYVHDGESYTLDQDIIRTYESITVQDWVDQVPKKRQDNHQNTL